MLWAGAGAVVVEARVIGELIRRGHQVTVLGPALIADGLRAAGCAHIEGIHDLSALPSVSLGEVSSEEDVWLRDHIWLGPAREQAQEVAAAVKRVDPDVVVCDHALFGAMVGAEASGLPRAALSLTLYAGHRYRSPDDPRRTFWEAGLDRLNEARRACGLRPLPSVLQQPDGLDRLLVLSLGALHEPAIPLPGNLRYVGPQLEPPPAQSTFKPGRRPLIVISFSTSRQGQVPVLRRVLEAVAGLPVEAVMTYGPALRDVTFELPANVRAHEYVPHAALLPSAAAVITHGGHGTVVAALAYGVPLLCLPLGRDQPYVAERVRGAGAAIVIDPSSRPPEVAQALRRLLDEPAFGQSAARLQTAIAAAARGGGAVAELEALAGRRQLFNRSSPTSRRE